MMRRTIQYVGLVIAAAVFANAAAAQQAGQERDPFFGDGPRSSATNTSQASGEWGRDPFSKPFEGNANASVAVSRGPERKLTGIIYGKSDRIAIINGEMVKEGSMVGDQKLMTIRKRSIVLMNSTGGTEEIFLENFSIRK
jgi:hypothetical protein